MEIKQFERMIRKSRLNLDSTMSIHLRFIVFIHVQKEFGIRSQCDTLAFGRDEFEAMTEDDALVHIRECEERLLRAAQTNQGILVYKKVEPAIRLAQKPVRAASSISYPAH